MNRGPDLEVLGRIWTRQSMTLGARVVSPADADVTVRAPLSLVGFIMGDGSDFFCVFRILRDSNGRISDLKDLGKARCLRAEPPPSELHCICPSV